MTEEPQKPLSRMELRKKEVADKINQAKARDAAINRAMEIAFATPEGKLALRWIMDECGYGVSAVAGNKDLNLSVLEGTLYNAARQNVYMRLRQRLPKRILMDVEYQDTVLEKE